MLIPFRNVNNLVKMDKKGQLTLFVIAAVIAVSVVSIFFMFRSGIVRAPISTENANVLLSSKSENLRDYTSECIEKISYGYFRETMAHGGYYKYKNLNSINYLNNDNIVLLYNTSSGFKNNLPSLNNICGTSFENYLEDEGYEKLDECLKDFSPFRKDIDVKPSLDRKVIADCSDEEIVIGTDWTLDISRADASLVVQQKDTKLLVPMKKIWTVSNDILNEESKGSNFVGDKIENYLDTHKSLWDHLRIRAEVIKGAQKVHYITSKPYRLGENQSTFIFAIDKDLKI